MIPLGILVPSEIEHRTYRPPVNVCLRIQAPHSEAPAVPPSSALEAVKSLPLRTQAPLVSPLRPLTETRVSPCRLGWKPVVPLGDSLSRPSPVKTEEGQREGVQEEVVAFGFFEAAERSRALGVVWRLERGLDDGECCAVVQMRFITAQRDGKPVDASATLRVVFELAGWPYQPGEQA